MTRILATLASVAMSTILTASASLAQRPPGQRVVGTIEKIDGKVMQVKSRNGADVTVLLSDNVQVTGVEKASLTDIKPGSYIGSGAMPQPDGTQKAMEVHIFAEAQRGLGEGHRPWAGAPQGTMTNGTVGEAVTAVGNERISVRYKGGEKIIVVPPGTPVVRLEAGQRSELKPGAHISIFGAVKNSDGSFAASGVSVGRGGVVPR